MARYIDADIAEKIIAEKAKEPDYQHDGEDWRCGLCMAETAIEETPTADVVEVVRCSECKHLYVINKAPIYARCGKHGIVFEHWKEDTREHYCSYGERKPQKEVAE